MYKNRLYLFRHLRLDVSDIAIETSECWNVNWGPFVLCIFNNWYQNITQYQHFTSQMIFSGCHFTKSLWIRNLKHWRPSTLCIYLFGVEQESVQTHCTRANSPLSLLSPVWRLWLLRLRRLLLGAAYHLRGTLMHIGEYSKLRQKFKNMTSRENNPKRLKSYCQMEIKYKVWSHKTL